MKKSSTDCLGATRRCSAPHEDANAFFQLPEPNVTGALGLFPTREGSRTHSVQLVSDDQREQIVDKRTILCELRTAGGVLRHLAARRAHRESTLSAGERAP